MEEWKAKFAKVQEKAKEIFQKIPANMRKWLIGGAIVLVVAAVGLAVALNQTEYSVLYAEVNSEDAASIGAMLQEMGVDYRYDPNGTIRVNSKVEDQVRMQLMLQGYPKSGFAYDTYINNTSGMTTESANNTYLRYELQDRLGATISLLNGVQDAKVTIALGEQQRYVLQDKTNTTETTASVVVQMKNNQSLSQETVAAIQNLVSHGVSGLKPENVAVMDQNGLDLTLKKDDGFSNNDAAELAELVENQISAKVMNLLAPIYGSDNVRVSVKGTVNMERLIRESTIYSTPEKIDEQDKQGIVSNESITEQQGENSNQSSGGVTGAETNTDTTVYDTVGNENSETYSNSSIDRDYLVNQIKEQGYIDPGMMSDVSVSVVLNNKNENAGLTEDQLKQLIGNASGIAPEQQQSKITVLMTNFYEEEGAAQDTAFEQFVDNMRQNWFLYVVGIVGFLIILIIILVILKKRKKKKLAQAMEAEGAVQPIEIPIPKVEPNPEIHNIQNEKSVTLRQNIRDFAEQNPEISAHLLKEWLNGGSKDE